MRFDDMADVYKSDELFDEIHDVPDDSDIYDSDIIDSSEDTDEDTDK